MAVVEKSGRELEEVLQNGASNPDIRRTENNIDKALDNLGNADESGTSLTEVQADVKKTDKTIEHTSENPKSEIKSEGNAASQDENEAQKDVGEVEEEVKEQDQNTEEVKQEEETENKALASDDVNKNEFRNEVPEEEGERI
jgi:hypothetical protein